MTTSKTGDTLPAAVTEQTSYPTSIYATTKAAARPTEQARLSLDTHTFLQQSVSVAQLSLIVNLSGKPRLGWLEFHKELKSR